MSDTASISAGIAWRYATALFDLAKESKKLSAIEKDLDVISAALGEGDALNDLISSPIYSREEAGNAIGELAKAMKLSPLFKNTLGLLSQKRRLFILPALISALRKMIAEDKGEVTAEVTAAKKLSAAQSKKLAAALKKTAGKDVIVETTIDETLIGGMIVKLGSKMIDTSIKSKLSNLQSAMKEVG